MVEEDFLSVDPKIPGQNFVCLSFVSPEKIIKQKNRFILESFFNHISEKFKLDSKLILNEYESYVTTNKEKIDEEYEKTVDFATSVRGVKIRGTYDTQKEANIRAQVLQKRDKSFHVFVGQVGYWLPWDPDPEDMENQEYQEGHLNTLVKKYKNNQYTKDIYYEEMKQKKMDDARKKANIEKAVLEKEYVERENKNKHMRDRNISISDECLDYFKMDKGKKYSRIECLNHIKEFLKDNDLLKDGNITTNPELCKLFNIDENVLLVDNDLDKYIEPHITSENKSNTNENSDSNHDNKSSSNQNELDNNDISLNPEEQTNIFSDSDPWVERQSELSK